MTDLEFAQLEAELYDDFPLPLQSLHGPRHWRRVDRYGCLLAAETGADLEVVRRFALFHDCQRFSEGIDPMHGSRGSEWALRYCERELSPERMQLLCLACEGHSGGYCSDNVTLGTCWDADRLDLDRVGTEVLPVYMSSDYGRHLAALAAEDRQRLAGLGRFWDGIDSLLH